MRSKPISDYIRAYSGALSSEMCNALIERFEAASDRHETKQLDGAYSFVQLDVTAHWPEVDAEITHIMDSGYWRYRNDLNLQRFWPSTYLRESLRLKRYLPGGHDKFAPHVDVFNQQTCMRYCTAILYLNDPAGGGETIFMDADVMIRPHPGLMVVFPPLWPFPHAGLPPLNKPKYILHSYLAYPPENGLAASRMQR